MAGSTGSTPPFVASTPSNPTDLAAPRSAEEAERSSTSLKETDWLSPPSSKRKDDAGEAVRWLQTGAHTDQKSRTGALLAADTPSHSFVSPSSLPASSIASPGATPHSTDKLLPTKTGQPDVLPRRTLFAADPARPTSYEGRPGASLRAWVAEHPATEAARPALQALFEAAQARAGQQGADRLDKLYALYREHTPESIQKHQLARTIATLMVLIEHDVTPETLQAALRWAARRDLAAQVVAGLIGYTGSWFVGTTVSLLMVKQGFKPGTSIAHPPQ